MSRARGLSSGLLAVLTGVFALTAGAQHQVTAPGGSVPPLPVGDATLTGRVLHQDGRVMADLDVALYALALDGRPGIGSAKTDADGLFRFDHVSGEQGVVYLVGVLHREIPFGQRAAFAPGQTELVVDLTVSDPVPDASALLVGRSIVQTEWIGAQLFVNVIHQIRNPEEYVIYVPKAERHDSRPVFRAALPPNAREFLDAQSGLGEGLSRDGDALAFWGPVHPGDQELRYGFLLDGPDSGGAAIDISLPFPAGAGSVSLLIPEADATPRGERMPDTFESEEIEGALLRRYELGGVAPGDSIALSLQLPESSADVHRLRIARADIWVDHDDTEIRVTAQYSLRVDSPTRLLARPGEALMQLHLPPGAEFLGVSASARRMAVVDGDSGRLELRGPVPRGASSLEFKYRVPLYGGEARLDLTFDRPVAVLNLLVADNGVAIETERLHRRRPFKQGTRVYLHNEAYQLVAGETVSVLLRPIRQQSLPRSVSLLVGLAAAGLAAFFLVGPLRSHGSADFRNDPEQTAISVEREALYDSIRDLDHDHDTGKLETHDFERMRADMRSEAIELLRRERSSQATASPPLAAKSMAAKGTDATAASCPACDLAVESDWKFCSHCGYDMDSRRGGHV